ncbi:hypothetical protein D3C83_223460 [compost metagenome]
MTEVFEDLSFEALEMFQGYVEEIAAPAGGIQDPDRTKPSVKLFNFRTCTIFLVFRFQDG